MNSTHLTRMVNASKLNQLSNRLVELRLNRGWSQRDATRRLGFSTPVILNRYESGERQPSKARIQMIASVYGVSAGWLLYGESSADAYPDFDAPQEVI